MKETFTLTREDHGLFQKQAIKLVWRRIPRGGPFLLNALAWFFAGMAASTFARIYANSPALHVPLAILAGFITAAALSLFVGRLVSRRLIHQYAIADHGPMLAPQSLRFDERGLTLTTQRGLACSQIAWPAFIGLAEDAQNFYLFLDPLQGIIVPKTLVDSGEDALIRSRVSTQPLSFRSS